MFRLHTYDPVGIAEVGFGILLLAALLDPLTVCTRHTPVNSSAS